MSLDAPPPFVAVLSFPMGLAQDCIIPKLYLLISPALRSPLESCSGPSFHQEMESNLPSLEHRQLVLA